MWPTSTITTLIAYLYNVHMSHWHQEYGLKLVNVTFSNKYNYSYFKLLPKYLLFFLKAKYCQQYFMIIGTRAYDKLEYIIMRKSLLNDIKKLSPNDQTSSLEGFHSTLNQWHPKMVCFSWLGTMCR